jgi:hypothetical protein
MARAEFNQSASLQNQDQGIGSQDQTQAQNNYQNLNPFLQNELRSPQGYSQQALTSMLGSSMAGTGGATSGVTGQAALQDARTRNASGFSGALDAAQRMRGQQNAQASEKIAGDNATLQNTQQQSAAGALQGLYGTNSDAALKALGLSQQTIPDELKAGQQARSNTMNGIQSAISVAGQIAGML